MSLKLYVDHASQPSRALIAFCKINNIPHEIVQTRIAKGEHRSSDYAKVNPTKKLPSITHGDFNLFQSHAILRYLAKTFNVPEHWYPRNDPKKAALIDSYLDWHHTNTRKSARFIFWSRFAPSLGLSAPKSYDFEETNQEIKAALEFIDSFFLGEHPYILSEQPSIADLSCYEELAQYRVTDYDLSSYKNIQKWFERVEQIQGVAEENEVFNKFVKYFMEKFPIQKL